MPKPALWLLALIPAMAISGLTGVVIGVALAASKISDREITAPLDDEEVA